MSDGPMQSDNIAPTQPRDAGNWAQHSGRVSMTDAPINAMNLNVDGRQVVGPLQGFGPMWQKTYRMDLGSARFTPAEIIQVWKENFPSFWPAGNAFYAPLMGIAPGEVALINSSLPGGMPLSTGVMVLYADDESFTLMTTQGHPFSGWVTFSAQSEGDHTVVQAQLLMRANDPIYEIGMRLGGHKQEDRLWQHTLRSLGGHVGVVADVETQVMCVDPKMQWRNYRNVWQNAGARSTLYMMTSPIRTLRSAIRSSRR